ncbi:Transcriptional regulator of nonfermentable carbon utilization [Nowakowskiella sp. JEL0407]|nr:Transcriptional regulator of nonfermentable carbon utilization [Nowakowskiella sp. JEL0407]
MYSKPSSCLSLTIKRDLASTCTDGTRKIAKYLLDEENLSEAKTFTSPASETSTTPLPSTQIDPLLQFNTPIPGNFTFGSESVNLEYAFLSSIAASLNLHSPPVSAAVAALQLFPDVADDSSSLTNNLSNNLANNLTNNLTTGLNNNLADGLSNGMLLQPPTTTDLWTNGSLLTTNANLGVLAPTITTTTAAPGANGSGSVATSPSPWATPQNQNLKSGTGGNVYTNVSEPYDYREGFHYLVHYVKSRMEKDDIMRICRSLAHFRPSFMAQMMHLSKEDLIFMEKCFQRTLLEFERLILCSGTPTVVWRRTGEIALVGKEFSILTQWSRDQLLSKKTYIYELMDNNSAVEYWEKFSLIAFDNCQQSVMTLCTLMSPDQRPLPCTFCFTIKRDIFDVPLAVVGNFLPLFKSAINEEEL